MGSADLDGDSLFRPAGLRTLRQRYCKHTLLEARLDLVSVDVTRHLKGALEGAEAGGSPVAANLGRLSGNFGNASRCCLGRKQRD